ncbi:MAG: hypothetical protein LBN25_04845 [Christensenellaceae bacterium]|jgi:hypothetical protein|nr:hypothetical protein [Christensenellaceae bacterium]
MLERFQFKHRTSVFVANIAYIAEAVFILLLLASEGTTLDISLGENNTLTLQLGAVILLGLALVFGVIALTGMGIKKIHLGREYYITKIVGFVISAIVSVWLLLDLGVDFAAAFDFSDSEFFLHLVPLAVTLIGVITLLFVIGSSVYNFTEYRGNSLSGLFELIFLSVWAVLLLGGFIVLTALLSVYAAAVVAVTVGVLGVVLSAIAFAQIIYKWRKFREDNAVTELV